MILSLSIATIVIVPTIAMVGVSPIGMNAIGGKRTATHTANMTFWSSYSAYGLLMVIPFVMGGALLVTLLIIAIQRIEKGVS